MAGELISICDVTFNYDFNGWGLLPCSFSLRRGEVVGIIGPNGSGKSTLLKIAAGVLEPLNGKVIIKGKEISSLKRRDLARLMGYLPQNAKSHNDYTVEEVVAFGRFPYLTGAGFLSHSDLEIISRCMEKTGIADYGRRPLKRLSGGEVQRVLLASVLAQEPELLLLDEPTSALDLNHQVKFFRLLSRLASSGIGAAVVTHDLNLASLFSDRIIMLRHGEIACQGTPDEVLTEYALKKTYGEEIEIARHPANGRPVVFPGMECR